MINQKKNLPKSKGSKESKGKPVDKTLTSSRNIDKFRIELTKPQKEIVNFFNLPIFSQESIGVEGIYTIKNLPRDIANKISYGLTINSDNDKANISPIVDSLIVENENKDYVFTLKDNIFWHNGKKLIASDIDYSSISGIKVSVLSENKIKISLDKQFSPILSALNKPLFKKNTIGLGQYKIKKYWLENQDLRFTQVLINMGYIPNYPGSWYYKEDYDTFMQSGNAPRDVLFWGQNYDRDMERLPETKWLLIRDMIIDHIKAVIAFMGDKLPERYKLAFEEELKTREE